MWWPAPCSRNCPQESCQYKACEERVALPEFMRALREVRDRHGIVLIADHIQTGFASIEDAVLEEGLAILEKTMRA